jgi:AAA+ superfamily predicted ATPase
MTLLNKAALLRHGLKSQLPNRKKRKKMMMSFVRSHKQFQNWLLKNIYYYYYYFTGSGH